MTLLHPPYTAWHLSYVVIGAALAPAFQVSRLAPTLVAFFLAVGIGAHALDELAGRPLGTHISARVLTSAAALSIAAATAIGAVGAATINPWLGVFVAAGFFIVVAYNLEVVGGRFHSDLWFAFAWGGFPLLTAHFVSAEALRPEVVPAVAFAVSLSLAQRRLSTQVRDVRRHVTAVRGRIERAGGTTEAVTRETLIEMHELALRALVVATIALAVALVVVRVT